MVGSFRRMIAIVEATGIWCILRAVTLHLWRGYAVRWRRASTVRLLHLLSLLIIRRRLGVDVIIVFPFSMPLWWSSRWTLVALPSSRFSSCKGGGRSRCTASNSTSGGGIRVVLVRLLVSVPRRASSILKDGTNLGRRACHPSIGWERTLIWGTTQVCWWRWRRSCDVCSMRAIIRI